LEGIGYTPVLNDLSISNAVDVHALNRNRLVGRCYSQPVALMRCSAGDTSYNKIALCNMFFDRELQTGECRSHGADVPLGPFNTGCFGVIVIDV
jgi:hypothetical protein